MIRRLFAFFLSLVLFFTQVLFAHAAEKNLWEERRQSQALLGQLTSPLGAPLLQRGYLAPSASNLSPLVSLLSVDGVVRDIKRGNGSSTVVYIQDVHGQIEAQKHIGSMILKTLAVDPNAAIGLEGAAGRIPIETFRGASTAINKEIGSFFLNTGLITGAEYAGFAVPAAPRMFGLEDADLYLKNVAAVRAALPRQQEQLARIEKEKIRLQNEKRGVYSASLSALDEKWRGYQDGGVTIGDYISSLASLAPPAAFPTISLFLKTWAVEKTLSFDKAERERNRFLSRLVEKLGRPDVELLVRQSAALRSGAMTYPDYYRSIKAVSKKAGVPLFATPEFDRYVGYVLQADAIRPEALLSELSQYEKTIWARLCETPEQRRLYQASLKLGLTEKLARLTMTSQEWNEYKPLRDANNLSVFESFYDAAEARNAALSSNFRSKMGASKISVLVAGGFHSAGLTELLAKGDVTFITVTPKLTKADGVRDNGYLNVFTRDKTPLEKLFEAPKISIPLTPATAPIANGNPAAFAVKELSRELPAAIAEATSQGTALVENEKHIIAAARVNSILPPQDEPPVVQGKTDGGMQVAVYFPPRLISQTPQAQPNVVFGDDDFTQAEMEPIITSGFPRQIKLPELSAAIEKLVVRAIPILLHAASFPSGRVADAVRKAVGNNTSLVEAMLIFIETVEYVFIPTLDGVFVSNGKVGAGHFGGRFVYIPVKEDGTTPFNVRELAVIALHELFHLGVEKLGLSQEGVHEFAKDLHRKAARNLLGDPDAVDNHLARIKQSIQGNSGKKPSEPTGTLTPPALLPIASASVEMSKQLRNILERGVTGWPASWGKYPVNFENTRAFLSDYFLNGLSPGEIAQKYGIKKQKDIQKILIEIFKSFGSGTHGSQSTVSSAFELLVCEGWLMKIAEWVKNNRQGDPDNLPPAVTLKGGGDRADSVIIEQLHLPLHENVAGVKLTPCWDGRYGYIIEVSREGMESRRYLIATVNGYWLRRNIRFGQGTIGHLLEKVGPVDLNRLELERVLSKARQLYLTVLPTSKKQIVVTFPSNLSLDRILIEIVVTSLETKTSQIYVKNPLDDSLLATLEFDMSDVDNPVYRQTVHVPRRRRPKKIDVEKSKQEGLWLQEMRRRLGLSQEKLAEKLRPGGAIVQSQISKWESGRGTLPDGVKQAIQKMVDALDELKTEILSAVNPGDGAETVVTPVPKFYKPNIAQIAARRDKFIVRAEQTVLDPHLGLFDMSDPRVAPLRATVDEFLGQTAPAEWKIEIAIPDSDIRLTLEAAEIWKMIGEGRSIRLVFLDTNDKPFVASHVSVGNLRQAGTYTVRGETPVPPGSYQVHVQIAGAAAGNSPGEIWVYVPKVLFEPGDARLSREALMASVIAETMVELFRVTLLNGFSHAEAADRSAALDRIIHASGGPLEEARRFSESQNEEWTKRLGAVNEGGIHLIESSLLAAMVHVPYGIIDLLEAHARTLQMWDQERLELGDTILQSPSRLFKQMISASLATIHVKIRMPLEIFNLPCALISYTVVEGWRSNYLWARGFMPNLIGISRVILEQDLSDPMFVDALKKFKKSMAGHVPPEQLESSFWYSQLLLHLRSEHSHYFDFMLMASMGIDLDDAPRAELTEMQDILAGITYQLAAPGLGNQKPMDREALDKIFAAEYELLKGHETDSPLHRKAQEKLLSLFQAMELWSVRGKEFWTWNDLYYAALWLQLLFLSAEDLDSLERTIVGSSNTQEFLEHGIAFLWNRASQTTGPALDFVRGLLRELTWMGQFYRKSGHFPPRLISQTPPAEPNAVFGDDDFTHAEMKPIIDSGVPRQIKLPELSAAIGKLVVRAIPILLHAASFPSGRVADAVRKAVGNNTSLVEAMLIFIETVEYVFIPTLDGVFVSNRKVGAGHFREGFVFIPVKEDGTTPFNVRELAVIALHELFHSGVEKLGLSQEGVHEFAKVLHRKAARNLLGDPDAVDKHFEQIKKTVIAQQKQPAEDLSKLPPIARATFDPAADPSSHEGWLMRIADWVNANRQGQPSQIPPPVTLAGKVNTALPIIEQLCLPISKGIVNLKLTPTWDARYGYIIEATADGIEPRRYLIATINGHWLRVIPESHNRTRGTFGHLAEKLGPVDLNRIEVERALSQSKQLNFTTLPVSNKLLVLTLPSNLPITRVLAEVDGPSLETDTPRISFRNPSDHSLLATIEIDMSDAQHPVYKQTSYVPRANQSRKNYATRIEEGASLRAMRDRLDLTGTQLGERLRPGNPVGQGQISDWERGKQPLPDWVIEAVKKMVLSVGFVAYLLTQGTTFSSQVYQMGFLGGGIGAVVFSLIVVCAIMLMVQPGKKGQPDPNQELLDQWMSDSREDKAKVVMPLLEGIHKSDPALRDSFRRELAESIQNDSESPEALGIWSAAFVAFFQRKDISALRKAQVLYAFPPEAARILLSASASNPLLVNRLASALAEMMLLKKDYDSLVPFIAETLNSFLSAIPKEEAKLRSARLIVTRMDRADSSLTSSDRAARLRLLPMDLLVRAVADDTDSRDVLAYFLLAGLTASYILLVARDSLQALKTLSSLVTDESFHAHIANDLAQYGDAITGTDISHAALDFLTDSLLPQIRDGNILEKMGENFFKPFQQRYISSLFVRRTLRHVAQYLPLSNPIRDESADFLLRYCLNEINDEDPLFGPFVGLDEQELSQLLYHRDKAIRSFAAFQFLHHVEVADDNEPADFYQHNEDHLILVRQVIASLPYLYASTVPEFLYIAARRPYREDAGIRAALLYAYPSLDRESQTYLREQLSTLSRADTDSAGRLLNQLRNAAVDQSYWSTVGGRALMSRIISIESLVAALDDEGVFIDSDIFRAFRFLERVVELSGFSVETIVIERIIDLLRLDEGAELAEPVLKAYSDSPVVWNLFKEILARRIVQGEEGQALDVFRLQSLFPLLATGPEPLANRSETRLQPQHYVYILNHWDFFPDADKMRKILNAAIERQRNLFLTEIVNEMSAIVEKRLELVRSKRAGKPVAEEDRSMLRDHLAHLVKPLRKGWRSDLGFFFQAWCAEIDKLEEEEIFPVKVPPALAKSIGNIRKELARFARPNLNKFVSFASIRSYFISSLLSVVAFFQLLGQGSGDSERLMQLGGPVQRNLMGALIDDLGTNTPRRRQPPVKESEKTIEPKRIDFAPRLRSAHAASVGA